MRFVELPIPAPLTASVRHVVAACLVQDYELAITFSDGTTRRVDIAPFLRHAHHPAVRVYLDPARFAAFTVRDGDLMWGDYDLIFPVEDLYAGHVQ